MQRPGQCIDPKLPNRTEPRGEQAEKQDGSPDQAQQHIEPQFSFGPAEQEQEYRQQDAQTVKAVPDPEDPRPALSEGTDQVIAEADAQSQQDRLPE